MDEEIIGQCSECGTDCTDRDLIGNQVELGFPVLWCSKCIDKSFDVYEAELSQRKTVFVACMCGGGLGILLALTGLVYFGLGVMALAVAIHIIYAHKHGS